MMFFLILTLLGSPDPMDFHAGDFLDQNPNEALNLAADAYQNGEWYEAATYYLNALAIDPTSSNSIFNLSCCYGLMGEDELATLYLRRAYINGFTDLGHINGDTDFDLVREKPIFSAFLDSLNAVTADEPLGELHWFDSVESFFYRVKFPEGFNPPTPLPVVIGLHGLGDSADNFIGLWERIENPDFIFVVPQAPYPIGDNAFSWYRGDYGTEEWGHSLLLAAHYVLDLVDQVQNEYPVSDIYLFGFSQGAALSLYTGIIEPELFTAIIPASGWLPEDFISAERLLNSSEMRIELMHSPEDGAVPFEAAQRAVSVLSVNNWDATLHITDGPHTVVMDELNLILADLGLLGTE